MPPFSPAPARRGQSCQLSGSASGRREPDPDPGGTGDEDDRGYAGVGEVYPGIDLRVPGSVGLKVARADVGNRGRVSGTDALAADDGPEVRERVRALQRGRHGRLVGEDQPAHLHQEVTMQGSPPPGTPRTGFAGPTYGPVTGVIVSNFRIVAGPGPVEAATPCTAATLTRAAPPIMPSSQLILRISHLFPGHADSTVTPLSAHASADHTSRRRARFNSGRAPAPGIAMSPGPAERRAPP